MKVFYFFDEDDSDNLPADFQLLPLDVSYLDAAQVNSVNPLAEVQRPKILPLKASPQEQIPSE